MRIGVVIQDGRAIAIDLSSGHHTGKVGDKNARAASSNGRLIAVACDGKRIGLYKASNRQRVGAVGKKGAVSLDLHPDKLLASYADGKSDVIDLSLFARQLTTSHARLQALAERAFEYI